MQNAYIPSVDKMCHFLNSKEGGFCNLWNKVIMYWLNNACIFSDYNAIHIIPFIGNYLNFSVYLDSNTQAFFFQVVDKWQMQRNRCVGSEAG